MMPDLSYKTHVCMRTGQLQNQSYRAIISK